MFRVEHFKENDAVKSETRAERLYFLSPDGTEYLALKYKLKAIEKMLSALRMAFEQLVKEGQNMF